MKNYFIGNKPIIKTLDYTFTEKRSKAERIFKNVIAKVYPNIKKASFSSHWAVSFESNTHVIEYLGFKIAVQESIPHPNTYFFSIIL